MNSKSFLAITGLVVTLLATGTYMAMGSSKTETATVIDMTQTASLLAVTVSPSAESAGATTPQPTRVSQTSPVTSLYKDGTYSASGTYNTPEGKTETIAVSVTLKNDVIVDSRVTPTTSNDHESQRYQKQFIAGYKQLVTERFTAVIFFPVASCLYPAMNCFW